MVRSTGLEPVLLRTRPSNVRVCQFRHDRKHNVDIIFITSRNVNLFFVSGGMGNRTAEDARLRFTPSAALGVGGYEPISM